MLLARCLISVTAPLKWKSIRSHATFFCEKLAAASMQQDTNCQMQTNKCLNVCELVEVLHRNKRWPSPFPCCPVNLQWAWKQGKIEKGGTSSLILLIKTLDYVMIVLLCSLSSFLLDYFQISVAKNFYVDSIKSRL